MISNPAAELPLSVNKQNFLLRVCKEMYISKFESLFLVDVILISSEKEKLRNSHSKTKFVVYSSQKQVRVTNTPLHLTFIYSKTGVYRGILFSYFCSKTKIVGTRYPQSMF